MTTTIDRSRDVTGRCRKMDEPRCFKCGCGPRRRRLTYQPILGKHYCTGFPDCAPPLVRAAQWVGVGLLWLLVLALLAGCWLATALTVGIGWATLFMAITIGWMILSWR